MSKIKCVLVTGGAGYIGSHTCLYLLEAGYDVVVIDNLSNSKFLSLERVQALTGKKLGFIEGDIKIKKDINSIFRHCKIDAVIHFAGFKSVAESVTDPLNYYQNNVYGTINLLRGMEKYSINNIVFSSSATVYGEALAYPIKENSVLSAKNPYGRTKLIVEEMLRDLCMSSSSWNASILRYFNPVGAHHSGAIGEDPKGIPSNIMPFISQVAVGKLDKLSIFGNDYPTVDGTGVRDYIHVVDLAKGHISALKKLNDMPGLMTHNLGTGKGWSVLQLIAEFEKVSGKKNLF